MEELVLIQRHFFNLQKTKSIDWRVAQLKKLRKLVVQYEQEMYAAIYKDFQKSEHDTFLTEIQIIYQDIDEAILSLYTWAQPESVRTNFVNLPAKSWVQYEPYGVCLVIGAWNYPYQLAFCPAIAAIAAGNTVVMKPSELPHHAAVLMEEMVNKHFEAEFFHVVNGDVEVAQQLLATRFDKIFFTGSVPVGRLVYQAAAKYLTPVTLELGGKSPVVVSAQCHLRVAAKRVVWGKFLNAGQTCIAPDYILVEQSIYQSFLDAMVAQIKANDYRIENQNYVQIIHDRHFNRLAELIQSSNVLYGGDVDASKRFISPTLIQAENWKDTIMQEEIFGPLLPIIPYRDYTEALDFIRQGEKPLSAYLFSNSRKEQTQFTDTISFGGGAINDVVMHITNPNLPFGGVGESGIGNYHGIHGFKTFSHAKSIFKKPNYFEPNLKFPPYSRRKLNWVKRILKWF